MRLARVTGTVNATIKSEGLVGRKLLVCDMVDASEAVVMPSVVVVDTCGAGVGDHVIVATGSAARIAADLATAPVDLAIVAVIDTLHAP